MTAAGFRLTRWAEDFVVLCKTRDEATRALAFAEQFLREELGVMPNGLHHQFMRQIIECPFDVELHHPGRAPTPLPRCL